MTTCGVPPQVYHLALGRTLSPNYKWLTTTSHLRRQPRQNSMRSATSVNPQLHTLPRLSVVSPPGPSMPTRSSFAGSTSRRPPTSARYRSPSRSPTRRRFRPRGHGTWTGFWAWKWTFEATRTNPSGPQRHRGRRLEEALDVQGTGRMARKETLLPLW